MSQHSDNVSTKSKATVATASSSIHQAGMTSNAGADVGLGTGNTDEGVDMRVNNTVRSDGGGENQDIASWLRDHHGTLQSQFG
jgi:hypothetical protein